jgi:AraC-like DNA-binding protein/ActR/RegA family two-component response regulator
MANDYSKLPVIVVEDNQPSMSLIDSLRNHKGINNILQYVDNREVISYLNEFEVAAIILQLDFPVSKGLRLLKQITSYKPHIPIVIITEVNQIDTAVECIKLGAFDYLTKPVSADRLVDSVTKALNFRCLNKVASLLRDTPCILNNRVKSVEKNESAPLSFILPGDVPDRLRKAVAYMDINLSKPLSLECIAQQACLSKYHFSREFKKYIGMSPIRFMMNRRICLATLLLQNKESSISKVATRSGFYDQSEFTKWFKKATGFTPSWYRKSFATKD